MHHPPFIRRLAQNHQGSAAIEFALVMPLLILVTLMIFDLGRLMLAYTSVNDVASDTARYASIHGSLSGGNMSDQKIIQYAQGQIAGLETQLLETQVIWSAHRVRGSEVTIEISSGFNLLVTRLIPIQMLTIKGQASFTVL